MLGEAAGAGGKPGMTAHPDPDLPPSARRWATCAAEAWIERGEGIKTWARGEHHRTPTGVTVEAEGLFILPRWAREAIAERADRRRLRVASVEAASRRSARPVTPRSPASVSRASSSALRLELGATGRSRASARAASYAPGSETRSAAPRSSRLSALRAKICCSVVVRSERPRPRNETAQCSTAVTRFLKPVM